MSCSNCYPRKAGVVEINSTSTHEIMASRDHDICRLEDTLTVRVDVGPRRYQRVVRINSDGFTESEIATLYRVLGRMVKAVAES